MPRVSLDNGAVTELVTLNRFDAVQLNPSGGDIRFDRNRSSARRGQLVSDGEIATEIALQSNETLYVASEADGVTVEYRIQGFLDFRFPQANINIKREGFRSRVELNADQTANLTSGNSQTTNITADASELWELERLYMLIPDDFTDTGSDGVSISVDIESEEQGIVLEEVSQSTADSAGTDDQLGGLERKIDNWAVIGTSNDANFSQTAGALGFFVDEDSGINIKITNNSGETMTSTRQIRAQFAVSDV